MDDKGAASFPRFSIREQIQRFSIGTLLCFGIMINMELFQAKDHYILQSGDNALWCSRKDGSVAVRPGNACILTYNSVHVFQCFRSHCLRCCHFSRIMDATRCFKTETKRWITELYSCINIKEMEMSAFCNLSSEAVVLKDAQLWCFHCPTFKTAARA